MVFATSLVVFLLLCYCRYFDETFTAMLLCFSLLWLYLGNSQVSVYRTIGPTLVFSLTLPLSFLYRCYSTEHWTKKDLSLRKLLLSDLRYNLQVSMLILMT